MLLLLRMQWMVSFHRDPLFSEPVFLANAWYLLLAYFRLQFQDYFCFRTLGYFFGQFFKMIFYCFWGLHFSGTLKCFEPQKCFSGLMCFPILKVHSLQKLHNFFGMCFSLFFLFHFPWFQVWTVTISRNSLVLYLAFFVSNSSVQLL